MAAEARIMEELETIKHDLALIKEHLLDPDRYMTAEEGRHHEHALTEFKKGEPTSLEELEKELDI